MENTPNRCMSACTLSPPPTLFILLPRCVPPSESRRTAARATVSACRAELDAALAQLRTAGIGEGPASTPLAGLLGEARASIDTCADRLGQEFQTLPRRRGGSPTPDELLLEACKARIGAFVAEVDAVCAEQLHNRQARQGDAAHAQGERLLMQARALRRAMLGPEGIGRQARGRHGGDETRFQNALDRLDAALAGADRLRADYDAEGSLQRQDTVASFVKAAQEASNAAEELQKAAEAGVEQAGDRVEGARELVRMALSDVEKLETDAKESGVDGERSVVEAMRVARRKLVKMSDALGSQDRPEAPRRGQARIEALVASGNLEAALRSADAARTEVARACRALTLETDARSVLSKETARVDATSLEAQKLGLLDSPAVARALQACRAAATTAERYDGRGRRVLPDKREELAREYMAAALRASEATDRAEEILSLERESAVLNLEARRRLEERLEQPTAAISLLQDRLDCLVEAAEHRRASLEGVRALTASWTTGNASKGPRGPLPAELAVETAARAKAEAEEGLDAAKKNVQSYREGVASLGEDVSLCLQRVTVAEIAIAEAEVRGRRRDDAFARLKRAAEKTHHVSADARASKVVDRSAVADSLAAAADQVRDAVSAAVNMAGVSGPGEVDADAPLLACVGRAEETAESAVEVLARERLLVEQGEIERQERSSELWAASRRLEELDTRGVVGDDPEAVAMVLEARSEVVQVRVGADIFVLVSLAVSFA